ncbi:MAG: LPS export ABC transporter periplasmic protein LptC [Chitinophagaceae bacterium]
MFLRKPINLLTALLTGCFVLYGCENDLKDLAPPKDKRAALEEGHMIESYLSQNGKVKGKLTAPLMYRYQVDSPYVEFPKSLHIDFFNDSLVKESQLDAKYGKFREWENKVFLKDSVVVINVLRGDTLRCEELWWDQNAQKFYTNKPARYSQKDKFVNYGKNGLEAKQDLSNLVFYDNSGTLPVPKDSLTSNSNSLPGVTDSLAKSTDSLPKPPVK